MKDGFKSVNNWAGGRFLQQRLPVATAISATSTLRRVYTQPTLSDVTWYQFGYCYKSDVIIISSAFKLLFATWPACGPKTEFTRFWIRLAVFDLANVKDPQRPGIFVISVCRMSYPWTSARERASNLEWFPQSIRERMMLFPWHCAIGVSRQKLCYMQPDESCIQFPVWAELSLFERKWMFVINFSSPMEIMTFWDFCWLFEELSLEAITCLI